MRSLVKYISLSKWVTELLANDQDEVLSVASHGLLLDTVNKHAPTK